MAYVLVPGWVISKSDGDQHYIKEDQLAQLYGINFNEIRVGIHQPYDIYLCPKADGNYNLPTNQHKKLYMVKI